MTAREQAGAALPEPGPVYRLTLGTLTLAAGGTILVAMHVGRNIHAAVVDLRAIAADRRLERAEARAANRARSLDAWDRLGCLPDDETTGDAK
jgi:hypothetical protein